MTLSGDQFEELSRLTAAVREDRYTPQQAAQLNAKLIDDPSACDIYARYVLLEAMLEFELSAGRRPTNPPHRPHVPVFSLLATAYHGTIGFFSQEIPFALLMATIVTGVGLLVGSMVYVTHHQQIADDVSISSPLRSAVKSDLEVVGRVTGMVDVKWADINTATEQGHNVVSGRRFDLSSGLLEITYDTGAKVILQGPVTYEVDSHDSGFLSVGRLTAKLEKRGESGRASREKVVSGQWPVASEERPGGRGQGAEPANQKSEIINHKSPAPRSQSPAPAFAVRTPTATVTDLGTEFGVEVNEAGETDAQVFVGSVQVASTGAPDHKHSVQTKTLLAGQHARVGKDQIISTDDRDFQKFGARFARTMPKPLSLGDEYAKLVLSMKPVVYYRMDQWPAAGEKNHYVLVDSASGGYHGIACLDETFGKPSSPGRFGTALDLHGSMGTDYAFVKNYPKAENGQISVSAWVYAITLDPWAVVVANWHTPQASEPYLGQFAIGINDKFVFEVGMLQQDGGHLKVCEQCEMPLPRSQWQHVAFVADGEILRLYRNGREVGTSPCRGIARQSLPECLSIGCVMDKDGTRPRPGSAFVWNGRLDEIAVFNHALTAEQVRQLYGKQAIAK